MNQLDGGSYILSMKKIKRCSFYLLILMNIIGCQPHTPEQKTLNKEPVETQVQPVTPEEKPVFEARLERLNFQFEACQQQQCPDIEIYRLVSQYPIVNATVDEYILKYVKQILVSISAIQRNDDVLNESEIHNSSVIDQVSIASNNDTTAKEKLMQQLKQDLDQFMALSNEITALGARSQLNIYIKPQVLTSASDVVTIVINSSNYVGGAHGSTSQHYLNFDLERMQYVNLQHVIEKGKFKEFNQIAYEKFVQWLKEIDPDIEPKDYEKLWQFKVSENFYLSPKHLILQYNQYEIGAYAVGLPRLEIPYTELTQILKPKYLPTEFQFDNTERHPLKAQNK